MNEGIIDNIINKRSIIKILILAFISIILILTIKYYSQTYTVVIHYENIHDVNLIRVEGVGEASDRTVVRSNIYSGDKVRIRKESKSEGYQLVNIISYKGVDGKYKDGSVELRNNQGVIYISPDYSEDYYNQTADKVRNELDSTLKKIYPAIYPNYHLGEGEFYNFGKWYGVELKYNNNAPESSSSDTLKVIFMKTNNTWQLVTLPDVYLYAGKYPNIPHEIVSKTNQIGMLGVSLN